MPITNHQSPITAFVVAAPSSGCGKTTVTLGLLAALKRRGLIVAPFKVGPDFIDPGHHAAACGRVSRNLDGWMGGERGVREVFAKGCAGADLAVIEGVMGLFDGASGADDAGSSAEIACLLDGRVLLVIDARAQARSAAALVKGFVEFDPRLRFAGIIFNRVGGPRHAELLREALASVPGLPPLLGCLPRCAEIELPERHLGLVTADDAAKDEAFFARLADWVEEHVDVDGLLAPTSPPPGPLLIKEGEKSAAFGCESPLLAEEGVPDRAGVVAGVVRIAVARDAAFCFYYPENLELLEAAGAELAFFSPLRDAALPEGCAGLYLGGGYPELHAASLAANRPLLEDLRAFAEAGGPVYAECGGLIYLARGIVPPPGPLLSKEGEKNAASGCESPLLDKEGVPERAGVVAGVVELASLFPATARMLPRRKALGYREVTLTADSILGPAGTVARGHEFHYSELAMPAAVERVYRLARADGTELGPEGFRVGSVLASYVHLHFASNPALAANFVAACRIWRDRPG